MQFFIDPNYISDNIVILGILPKFSQNLVKAIVPGGGRPDLGNEALPSVKASTLLIVGGNNKEVIRIDRESGVTHLFKEPGTLEKVSELAARWFVKYLI